MNDIDLPVTETATDGEEPRSLPPLLRPALTLLVALSLVTGVAYPLVVFGLARGLFPHQSRGSLIVRAGHAVGSELIGQSFDAPGYFWGRPSATAPDPYNAAASAGSNLGPLNPALAAAVQTRIDRLRAADPGDRRPIPIDLVTASGSGLDPHISPAAADYQVRRVARARRVPEAAVRAAVEAVAEERQLGILGERRVNVLALNLLLDRRFTQAVGASR